jgi:hypothetical protein
MRAHVRGELAHAFEVRTRDADPADARGLRRPCGGERALDGRKPSARGIAGRDDQQQAQRRGDSGDRVVARGDDREREQHRAGDEDGLEPHHVVLAAHEHDLRCGCRDERRGHERRGREQGAPVRARLPDEPSERDGADTGHGRAAGGERGDVVGVDDPVGDAQDDGLA